ncbi:MULTISPECIES: carbohydrate ABC transporter permease [Paenibacillus]|uniref:Multiple sugar transport system permease protein n=2 Tax=Paenibacillus TaxID=44249 RepID=A0ABS4RSW0_PAEXY|nr:MULTISPECIES: sugar ABC transporter permease [Paenibacillus]UOK63607.1 sugar ABC transporter permease [Paenibacillus sp. OVF10]APO42983.1 ABC transporter [Paenibacillus xylanexedens]ETT35068.1 ABC transporter permease [Paenibacillus sp. FSL R5-192]KAA8753464.1 sugar ABC transporter permease [Paenibacillus sp. UASWS1643]KLU57857.1 ABC transporter [Paenibacillus sp. VT-400]
MRLKLWRESEAVLFTLPALIPLLIFWLGPLGYIVYLSFTDWDFMSPDKLFVGLDNYSYLLTNSEFYRSLKVTLLFGLGSVIPTIVGGLALAMLMNSKIKSSGIFRTLLFSPWVTPTVAVSIAWSWIFEPEVGLANLMLGWVGVSPIGWLRDADWALVAVLIVTLWKSIGWAMVFYLVALRNLPSDLLEAASIDGANGWDKFRSITLPLISPTTFFLSIILTIQSLQAYDQINVMTQGGPAGSTRTLLYMYYQSAFESFNVGEASSIAVVIILICVLLSGVSFLLGRRLVHY